MRSPYMAKKNPDDYPEPEVQTRAKAIFLSESQSDLHWEMTFRPGDGSRRSSLACLGYFGRRRYVARARDQLAAEKVLGHE
jgi:hypothetical protein